MPMTSTMQQSATLVPTFLKSHHRIGAIRPGLQIVWAYHPVKNGGHLNKDLVNSLTLFVYM